jgi:hypothetical protein
MAIASARSFLEMRKQLITWWLPTYTAITANSAIPRMERRDIFCLHLSLELAMLQVAIVRTSVYMKLHMDVLTFIDWCMALCFMVAGVPAAAK